ncbi:BCCT family transporter [Cognatishimia sp. SS12]|uniref:BCCT family transporter n=1 Tax=Cognatishimia sp. SS12 TaxID=2979465 RepID=UPI00232B31C4|nr:BCCT family transporter [Cognatishimia sp. SS12]MDC0738757.1 BCCT family transporter [Cognatishimia sp. SS12]
MTAIISFGVLLTLGLVAFCVIKWWNVKVVGVTPVPLFTFIAILFTSGLDVGLIMFPLGEFPVYADPENAEYGFTNPLSIEFGFWGFLIWSFYFLTAFYFCVIEPRVKFFEIPVVRIINNIVIIGTCAFTASLFLVYLPFYIPEIGDGETVVPVFYVIVFLTIVAASYSSTDIKYVRILSITSSAVFAALIIFMWLYAKMGFGGLLGNLGLLAEGYFGNIHRFALPINDYHEFYLFWWFAWSIMIGQFTARFVGGLRTQTLLLALLVIPSIPLAIWFSVLYFYHQNGIETAGLVNMMMIIVGISFVVNSLDSLIRLYSDNLSLTTARLGRMGYIALNVALLFGLTLAFQSQWLQIQWVGAVVVGIYVACCAYILLRKRRAVLEIKAAPEENTLDFSKIETVH